MGTPKVLSHGDRIIKQLTWDSFGNLRDDTLPELSLAIGFAGGLIDRDTGLVRFGYRDYDPAVGRFTAPDPANDRRGDGDVYDYCVDDPVSRVDPTGLWTQETFEESRVRRDGDGQFSSTGGGGGKPDAERVGNGPDRAPQKTAATHTSEHVENIAPKQNDASPENNSLSRDPAIYKALVEKYPHALDMKYAKPSIRLVSEAKGDILKAAEEEGMPAEAIVGAMLDENTKIERRYLGILDNIQDIGSSTVFPGLSYDSMKKYAESTAMKGVQRSFSDRYTWDVGPYNINMVTGFNIFERYILHAKASSSINHIVMEGLRSDSTISEKWDQFRMKCLLDPKGGAYVAAAVMREGEDKLRPYMQSVSPEERAALLVTYYKQGFTSMKRRYDERVAKTGERGPMRPGEGAIIFNNMDTIQSIISGR